MIPSIFIIFITLLLGNLQISKADQYIDQPIIGVFMHESWQFQKFPNDTYSLIPSSYVKFLEMGGSQVLPIHYDADKQYYDDVFNKINGLFFMGGGAYYTNDTDLGRNGYYMFQKAIEANKQGNYFPVWGTCLGFEMILLFSADFQKGVIGNITGESHVSKTINITQKGNLYRDFPRELFIGIQTKKLQYFNHRHDVTLSKYYENSKLNQFWRVLATGQNEKNIVFLNVIEAKDYPFYGTQFHPEKNSFEWKVGDEIHTLDGIKLGQYYANFFVEKCRKNKHQMTTNDPLYKNLIFNYNPEYMPKKSTYEQIYFFINFQSQHQQANKSKKKHKQKQPQEQGELQQF